MTIRSTTQVAVNCTRVLDDGTILCGILMAVHSRLLTRRRLSYGMIRTWAFLLTPQKRRNTRR